MPRPRVPAENRQRSVRACRPCKASKKRCDSASPCTSCVRRNCTAACVYDQPSRPWFPERRSSADTRFHRPLPTPAGGARETRRSDERIAIETPRDFRRGAENMDTLLDSVSQATTIGSRNKAGDRNYDVTPREPEPEAAEEATPKGRMMLNSSGEKFYFGDSAGVSFLQFVRHVVGQNLGHCKFTENKRQDVILEVAIPDDGSASQADLDLHQRKTLVDNFYTATAGVLDICTKDEIFHAVRNLGSGQAPLKDSIGCLAIAIGAQCVVSNTEMSTRERSRFFKHGQRLAFRGMLEYLSIDIIHVFLLMSFYLLGACRRNTAFLYIGIAARSAHALGLHAPEQYQHLSAKEQSLRIRAWKSLRILDLVVASVLCRPAASLSTPHDNVVLKHFEPLPDDTTRHLAVSANFQVCSILEDIVQHLDRKKGMSIPAAEQFLVRLRQWSDSVPPRLRKFSARSPLAPAEHEVAIGGLSMSCLYYFAVILVTRPTLISHLLRKLRSHGRREASSTSDTGAREGEKLAWVCIDSAVLMARTCGDAVAAGIIIDNMCLVKAWIFTASLILGFSKFVEQDTRLDIDDAFQGGIDTLRRLAYPSGCPQSEHYVEVLSNLTGAIATFRDKMANERRNDSGLYVSQLLVIDREADGGGGGSGGGMGRRGDGVLTPESAQPGPQGADSSDAAIDHLAGPHWHLEQFLGGESWLDGGRAALNEYLGAPPDLQLTGDGFLETEPLRIIFDEL